MKAFRKNITRGVVESARISGLSPSELAEEMGVTRSAITYAMKRYNIWLANTSGVVIEGQAARLPGFFLNALDAFCEKAGLEQQEVIRAALAEYMIKRGFNPYLWEGEDA